MPIPDAPDFQETVVTTDVPEADAPDFQSTVVAPGGTPAIAFYKSLTGPGETVTPGALTQAGALSVTGDLSFFGVPLAAQQPTPTTLPEVIAYLTNYGLFAAPLTYDDYIASLSPLAWWKLADAVSSPTAADSSGNGWTGTVTYVSGAMGVPGPISGDTAMSFGGGDKITTSLNVTAAAFSVIAWFNSGGTGNAPMIISTGVGGSAGFYCALNIPTNIQPYVVFEVSSGLGSSVVSGSAWHMFVVTWDGTTQITYVDGVLSQSGAQSGSLAPGTHPVELGYDDSAPASGMYGDLAQIALFNYVLTAGDISTAYGLA